MLGTMLAVCEASSHAEQSARQRGHTLQTKMSAPRERSALLAIPLLLLASAMWRAVNLFGHGLPLTSMAERRAGAVRV